MNIDDIDLLGQSLSLGGLKTTFNSYWKDSPCVSPLPKSNHFKGQEGTKSFSKSVNGFH